MYSLGYRVARDGVEAVKWYRKAADQGHTWAQFRLGQMHDNGEDIPENDAEAVTWYRRVAEQGGVAAQFRPGLMYADGEGVPKDNVKAYAWYNIAAAQGHDAAERTKKFAAECMTHEQRARAQELARQYWEAYVLPFRN